jgi:hypothetical protein
VKGGRERATDSSHMEMIHMIRKQKIYTHILVHDILQTWIEKSGITLAVPNEMYLLDLNKENKQ